MHDPDVAGDEMWLAMETKGSDFVFSSLLSSSPLLFSSQLNSTQLNSSHLISSHLIVSLCCFSFVSVLLTLLLKNRA